MEIKGSVALVTGANRGIGRHFVRALLERGAAKVYATARHPPPIDAPGVQVLPLDITEPAAVAEVAAVATDVTLLINNAGAAAYQDLVTGDLAGMHEELDTHLWGTLRMIRAFAPTLGDNGGGAILNVLSGMSWFSWAGTTSYSVAKAAEWALTNGVRLNLAEQRTLVTALHMGAVNTDMMARFDIDKLDPADVVDAALVGIEAGKIEVVVDDATRSVKAALAGDPAAFYAHTVSGR